MATSEWRRLPDGRVRLNVEIQAHTTAEIRAPGQAEPVERGENNADGKNVYRASAGTHSCTGPTLRAGHGGAPWPACAGVVRPQNRFQRASTCSDDHERGPVNWVCEGVVPVRYARD
ncbi:hypothetical protein Ade02nite_34240 [Paractinoplanes deccanensis]|uniref:Uncharacterized protein n=1 Tax=Paractinoplanes deccanensis TaxID=113561 RepID=A0ABQ3Y468_9ACTN|nr:hypothetical protein Ade02nite_34240 [Actinoplanes deccanensis]